MPSAECGDAKRGGTGGGEEDFILNLCVLEPHDEQFLIYVKIICTFAVYEWLFLLDSYGGNK